ncbi:HlyD family efflux transporter periplasmic adaptor subunit [Reyranella soli]|uniref:Multidrug transporter n=1 Tax=Reyranella soli TaxID=1230389 RepID=A0A512NA36_9HYPH|nr:HlyD family secretion protein [Reyranella soli]GEP55847.1 multidrug transporter [Reyranella soli]
MGRAIQLLLPWMRRLATLAIMAVAGVVALVTWDYYVTAPWTRDGRVRVQVASVAPQISGQITERRVVDNQFVHKGDVLYVIEPFDFEVTVRTNKAILEQKAADLQVKQVQSDRRQHLSNIATTPEEQQVFAGTALQAKAAFDAAQQQLAQAEINLRRTQIRSPVNGYVTNLLIGIGDYAQQGSVIVSVIDSDSYWIDGYFEETKMARVCIGDRVEAKLMGYAQPIVGHVATVTRGIGVANAASGVQGLPNVDPVYTWVRLAQRVPVRIAIDRVPPGVPLVAGMTATVTVRKPAEGRSGQDGSGPGAVLAGLKARLADVFDGPPAKPECIKATTNGQTESLTEEVEEMGLTPGQINPGLAPGMTASPTSR